MRTKIITIILSALLITSALAVVVKADDYAGLSLAQKVGEYHIRVNKISNETFTQMIEFFDGRTEFDQEVVDKLTPPSDVSDCDDNLSASCLAYRLNSEYQLLVESLQEDLERVDITRLSTLGNITSGIQDFGVSNDFANEQLKLSSSLQKQTLDFYQQTLFAYPLHVQYESTVEELNEFLSNLKEFKNRITIYPSKFHNATTAQCI